MPAKKTVSVKKKTAPKKAAVRRKSPGPADLNVEARNEILYMRTKASVKTWIAEQATLNKCGMVDVIERMVYMFRDGKVPIKKPAAS